MNDTSFINTLILHPKYFLLLIGGLFFFLNLNAQKTDSLSTIIDTNKIAPLKTETLSKKQKPLKTFFKKDYPSPKKAVLLAIIPGMGQIYNKKYWKLPLVYGALGGVIYAINYNTNGYNKAVQSIQAKADNMPQNDPFPTIPVNAVTSSRNSFDKNRQLSWIGLIGFYLISAGDAFVDAHLKDFNVDDDLSFKPILQTDFNNQPIIGLGFTINLSK